MVINYSLNKVKFLNQKQIFKDRKSCNILLKKKKQNKQLVEIAAFYKQDTFNSALIFHLLFIC